MHVSAGKQLSSHETMYMNGNFAVKVSTERNGSPIMTPEMVSFGDAIPHSGTCGLRVKTGNSPDHAFQNRILK